MPIVVPTPEPWADAADLAAYLQREVDDAQGAQVLRLAEAAVKAELSWDPVASARTISLGRVWLGRTVCLPIPATAVSNVTVTAAGSPMAAGSWWLWQPAGTFAFLGPADAVTITYTAGWSIDDLPPAIVLAYLDEAARRLDNPLGRKRFEWTVGSEQENAFYGTGGSDLSFDHRLDPYRALPGIG